MATGMLLLPLSRGLTPGRRRALGVGVAASVALIGFAAGHTLLRLGGSELDGPVRDWASSAIYVLVAGMVILRAVRIERARGPWIVIAVGVSLYWAGNLVWALWLEHVATPPIPSICDALWLSFYPASYLGVVLLARQHWRAVPAGVWLDGIVAGLGIGAIGAAAVFGPVLGSTTGSVAAVTTNLAYPVSDLLLAALVVGVLAVRGWRLDRTWALLGGGFLTLTVADSIYLLHVAHGSATSSNIANLFYMAGVLLLALAAWQLPGEVELPRTEAASTLLVPAAFALVAVGVLAYDQVHRLGLLAFTLSLLTILAALLRFALAFRDLRLFSETRKQAVTDDLTGLPNRRLFQQRLEESITRSGIAGHGMAVLIVDLDGFKELNDTLGHHSGDELLRQIGPRLQSQIRPVDTLARLGGDEFGIVLEAPFDELRAVEAASRVRAALTEPFRIQGLSLRVDGSVGIALYPEHADTAAQLLRTADVAMYQAKAAHSGSEIYALARDLHSRDRLTLAAELERGLRLDEIELHFQPQSNALTGEIVGVEALARWRHPAHGLLPPSEFIELAEKTGLARSLTRCVLELALAECAEWRAAGYDVYVAVNATASDLLDIELPAEIATALVRHRLPAAALVIEVTENSVLSDPIRIHDVLGRLSILGVSLSLDDFGTGYSSLEHLKSLPVDELKIDRSFVIGLAADPANAAIAHATIELALRLGKRVVAEGVEDQASWKELAVAGCHLIQGYIVSRPVPASELTALLERDGTPGRAPAAGFTPAKVA
jgi:diguanylate cyclase (GGDEF)-like protein